jgi:hypothetical protein
VGDGESRARGGPTALGEVGVCVVVRVGVEVDEVGMQISGSSSRVVGSVVPEVSKRFSYQSIEFVS